MLFVYRYLILLLLEEAE